METINIHILRRTMVMILTHIINNKSIYLDEFYCLVELLLKANSKEDKSLTKLTNEKLLSRNIKKDDIDYDDQFKNQYLEFSEERAMVYVNQAYENIIDFFTYMDLPIIVDDFDDDYQFIFNLSTLSLDHTKIPKDKIYQDIVLYLTLMLLHGEAFDYNMTNNLFNEHVAWSTFQRIKDDIIYATNYKITTSFKRYHIEPNEYELDDLIDYLTEIYDKTNTQE